MHELEVGDMKVLRMISGVSKRDQWENRITNEIVRESLIVESVEEGRWQETGWAGGIL